MGFVKIGSCVWFQNLDDCGKDVDARLVWCELGHE